MSVTRKRAEAIRKAAMRRDGHTSMGKCPICNEDIMTNQRTAFRVVDGSTARVHAAHVTP